MVIDLMGGSRSCTTARASRGQMCFPDALLTPGTRGIGGRPPVAMGTEAIVADQITAQSSCALSRVAIGPHVGPVIAERLHQGFGLAVRLGTVGPRATVAYPMLAKRGPEDARRSAEGVVGECATERDAARCLERQDLLGKARGREGALVLADAGVGQAGMVLSRQVQDLLADAAVLLVCV